MDKKTILEKIKLLNNEINFYYWKYYNNFILENLYNKDIYNIVYNDFTWKYYLSLKKMKKLFIKSKLELLYWIENNNNIINFSKSFWDYINKNLF